MRARRQRRPVLIWGLALAAALLMAAAALTYTAREREAEPAPIMVCVLDTEGKTISLELEQFLCGVLAAEMPASFAPEALQAQAVAARTYILRRMPPYGRGKHGAAAVCMDCACCQAYLDTEQLKLRWGADYPLYAERVQQAVAESAGQVLTWQGQLAETPYFSACGGSTECNAAVWGGDQPYLQAVDCLWDSHAARYTGSKRLQLSEAADLLRVAEADIAAMRVAGYTEGGRVAQLDLAGGQISGTELRSALALNSAAFSWLILDGEIIFSTLGYGHGVGLCQYGADGMARAGYDHAQILAHYYPGTELKLISELKATAQ